MRRAAICIAGLVLCCACGARTGLDAGAAPEADAALPFDTFPCSWSWGIPYEIARGGVYDGLRGAVHGTRDEAVVMATVDGVRVGARLALSNPPSLLDTYTLDPGDHDVSGQRAGWSSLNGCRLSLRDDDFVPVRLVDVRPSTGLARTCAFASVDSNFVDVRVLGDGDFSSVRYDESGEPLSECDFAATPSTGAAAPSIVRGPSGLCAAAWTQGGELTVRREDGAQARVALATTFALTDDPLRPAALLVRRSGRDTLHFSFFRFEGAIFTPELGSTTALHAEPLQVVTNETEALVPLDDGSIAIQPLSGSMLRVLPPPETDGRIEAMRLVMRAGASLGGALYVIREAGERSLRFAPLGCNR